MDIFRTSNFLRYNLFEYVFVQKCKGKCVWLYMYNMYYHKSYLGARASHQKAPGVGPVLANLEGVPRAPAQADEVKLIEPAVCAHNLRILSTIYFFAIQLNRCNHDVRAGRQPWNRECEERCRLRVPSSVGALCLHESSPTLLKQQSFAVCREPHYPKLAPSFRRIREEDTLLMEIWYCLCVSWGPWVYLFGRVIKS